MKTIKVTELEKLFIDLFIPMLYAEEGFSDVDVSDVADGMKMSKQRVKGILGSLVKKGICAVEDDLHYSTGQGFGGIIYLAEEFYGLHPEWSIENDKVELIVSE